IAGAFLSGRLAGKISPRRTVRYGYAVMLGAASFNLAYNVVYPPALPWTVLPVMVYTIGMSLAMPSIVLLILDLFPDNRGLAASLQGAQQSLFAGLTAGLLSPYASGTGRGLAVAMAVLVACGFVCWRLAIYMSTSKTTT
ncbi:MAG: Bcr/CflA family drug resistance efflux transporter, partial [Burkholderiales bacterium]